MTDPHLTDEDIRALLRGGLPGPKRLAADDHLAQCEPCRRRAEAALPPAVPAAIEAAFLGTATPAHPEFETLAAFVVSELAPDTRAAVQDHLAGCRRCRGEVQAMDAMRREIRDSPARVYAPAGTPPTPSVWSSLLRAPAWRPLLAAGAAAMVGVILFIGLRPGQPPGPPSVDIPRPISNFGGLSATPGAEEPQDGPVPAGPAHAQVTSDRPALHWSALNGADSYVVTLRIKEGAVPPVSSPALLKTEWTVSQPLTPGVTYQWSVQAFRGRSAWGPPSAAAAFRVRTTSP